MAGIFGTVNPLPNLAPSWNVAPTNDVPVVRRHPETGEPCVAGVLACRSLLPQGVDAVRCTDKDRLTQASALIVV
jgi:hypothetical protein